MIAATAAAMASGAFATLQPEVYEMTLTIKTTACKIAKTKNLCDENIVDSYRVKATQTLKGLFWGCDCPTIAEPKAFETFDDFGTSDASHGYVFWNKKDGTPFQTAEFGWELFHYIDPKFSSVEGTWDLVMTDEDDNVVVDLRGAGFGQAHYSAKAEEEWINTMSGNVAGTALPSALEYGCKACGEYGIGCAVWNFCEDCDEEDIDVPSTAYGTWSIKYNTTASTKYGKGVDRTAILSAYKFPADVKAYLIEVDAGSEPPAPEPIVQQKYTLAKQQLAMAQIAADDYATKDVYQQRDMNAPLADPANAKAYSTKGKELLAAWTLAYNAYTNAQAATKAAEAKLADVGGKADTITKKTQMDWAVKYVNGDKDMPQIQWEQNVNKVRAFSATAASNLEAYAAALKAEKVANEANKTADKAYFDWCKEKGGFDTAKAEADAAVDAAKYELEKAQMACDIAGVDCK